MKKSSDPAKGQVVVYKNKVEVRLEKETVWLTQAQIADLFGTQRPAITKHLANIFKAGELKKPSASSKMEHTAADGKVYNTQYYSLDAIISVGYRVNSAQATQFRIWATQVLRKHLVDGYTLNENRLKQVEAKYQELQKAVALIGNVAALEGLSPEAKGMAQVIAEYSRALDILDDFDHERLRRPKGTRRTKYELTYAEACKIIETMKQKFHDSTLVGREKDQGFKSSLAAIYQTINGKDAYPSVEEKAANLLYFVTKNHSFIDGNKRIAAALFICFLQGNRLLLQKDGNRRIDDNALVALTLMVAASKPVEKEAMIKVVLNLLA